MTETTQTIGWGAAPAAAIDRVGSRELEERIGVAVERGIDVLPLEGGPRLPLPPHVRSAVERSFDDGRPQQSQGSPALREAIVDAWAAEPGTTLDPANVVVTNGAMQALNLVFRSLLGPGDNVVVPTPNFFFSGAIALAGGTPRFVPSGYDEASGWHDWDPDALERALDDRTRAIVFSNPVNPSGYLPSPEVIAAVLSLAERRGIYVVSDESYDRFVFDGPMTPLAGLGPSDHAIVVRSFSKSLALAPWRIGYVVAPTPVVRLLTTVLEWESLYVSDTAQRAATAALTGPQDWLRPAIARYRTSRDAVWRAVNDNQLLSCPLPAAAPFVFVQVDKLLAAGVDPVSAFLAVGVPTVSGSYFGAREFVRLPFGGPADVIDRLIERIPQVGLAS